MNRVICSISLLSLAWVSGCDSDLRGQSIVRSGTITDIDAQSRTATLEWYTRKGEHRSLPGQVADNCKVTINGRVAELTEIREGDQATITAQFPEASMFPVVTEVSITRDMAEVQMPVPTTRPTTQPATQPEAPPVVPVEAARGLESGDAAGQD